MHVLGRWSVTVELNDGKQVHEWGEFCELDVPNKIVMTRRFGGNLLLGERETTHTYRLEPSPHGTPVTVREEGDTPDPFQKKCSQNEEAGPFLTPPSG